MTAPKASRQSVAVNRMLYSSDCPRFAWEDAARRARLARDFGVAAEFERRPATDIRALFDTSPWKPLQPSQLRRSVVCTAIATAVGRARGSTLHELRSLRTGRSSRSRARAVLPH